MSNRDTILMKLVHVKARDLECCLAIGMEPAEIEPDLLAFGREVWDQAMGSSAPQRCYRDCHVFIVTPTDSRPRYCACGVKEMDWTEL